MMTKSLTASPDKIVEGSDPGAFANCLQRDDFSIGHILWNADIPRTQQSPRETIEPASPAMPLELQVFERGRSLAQWRYAMHALIIEDEPLIAMTIEEILGECGFTSFDFATSGEQAIQAAENRCPALITADVELSPGSGIDAVNAICSGPPIPVIFITGSPSEVARRMPLHPLITKPFTSEAVMSAVKSVMVTHDKAQK